MLNDSNEKYYLKNLENGVTFLGPLQNDVNVICEKGRANRTSLEQAKQIKTSYIFGFSRFRNNKGKGGGKMRHSFLV
jgi:hypothetical protein